MQVLSEWPDDWLNVVPMSEGLVVMIIVDARGARRSVRHDPPLMTPAGLGGSLREPYAPPP
jgi:hypothetical protein